VADQGNGTPDQREQPLLPTPEARKDFVVQRSPSVLGPQPSTVTARERFAGASGGAPADTEGVAVRVSPTRPAEPLTSSLGPRAVTGDSRRLGDRLPAAAAVIGGDGARARAPQPPVTACLG
jgi:hypothetical protein